ncbi:MAG: TolC family protein [Halanaerobiales bacterium]
MKTAIIKSSFAKAIIVTITMALILLLTSTTFGAAELITLEEALEIGKENNYELEQKREAVMSLERERDILEAGIDWYVRADGNYSYNTEGPTFESPVIVKDGDGLGFTITGRKETLDGTLIESQMRSQDNDMFDFDDYQFKLDVSKRLYPILPTDTEKGFIQTDNRLIIAEADLAYTLASKEVEWLESYLEILRLEQRLEYSKTSYKLTEEELSKVKEQVEIDEAGQDQLLMAEISLQEAKLQQEQLLTSVVQARDSFAMELGLEDSSSIHVLESNYLNRFLQKANSVDITDIDQEVIELIETNNVQLREIILNIDYTEKELIWQEKDGDLKVNASGGYNYNAAALDEKDSVEISLGISYDFHDGGQQELAIEKIEAKMDNLQEQYDYTLNQLKLQLKAMLAQQKLNRLRLQSVETALEKARLEENLYKRQLDEGVITENQYKQKTIAVRIAEIDYQEAEDQLLLGKLRIALFTGLY